MCLNVESVIKIENYLRENILHLRTYASHLPIQSAVTELCCNRLKMSFVTFLYVH